MSVELYNGWYVAAVYSEIGPSSGNPTAYQSHNAQLIYDRLHSLGWTDNAIAGMLGNVNYESNLNPARVYPRSSFPNGGNTLADLDNAYAINRPNPAYGLVQWKGTTQTPPPGNQLVSYAIRHNSQWYDGNIQLDRLQWEYETGNKFHPQTVDGVYYTFSSYAASTASPEVLAKAWMKCYEGTESVITIRQTNARKWYDIITGGVEPPPVDWVAGSYFAQLALSYDGEYIPYSQADCIQFVNMVWKRVNSITAQTNLTMGTNSLWRSTRTFNTTDPDGNNPTLELWYQATVSQCVQRFGDIPPGALLFHKISEAGPPAIPPQYAGDGIGNFAHVGIYCGNDEVMQSGGADAASIPGGGVHKSDYDPQAWSHVAFVVYVDPEGEEPSPPDPDPGDSHLLLFISLLLNGNKRRLAKNVRKRI